MQTEVLATTQADAAEALVGAAHLLAVSHQPLELDQRLLDLGHRSRAVDELAVRRIELQGTEEGERAGVNEQLITQAEEPSGGLVDRR